jgi:hypothetical protein
MKNKSFFFILLVLLLVGILYFTIHILGNPILSRMIFIKIKELPQSVICTLQHKTWWNTHTYVGSKGTCIDTITDGGKTCTSSNNCRSGKCFIDRSAEPNSEGKYTGRCAYTGEYICGKASINGGEITQQMFNCVE